jgi:predicted RNase H-like HicB family nuclease
MQRYLVVIEKGENSFGAYAPDVPGCVAVGGTVEEVLKLFQEALEFHFEGMAQEGEAIPTPAYIEARFVEVEVPETISVHS